MGLAARIVTIILAGQALALGLAAGIGGWPGREPAQLIAFPDCETVGSGLIAQPAAAYTSLAFVPLGVWLAGDRSMPAAGRWLFAATAVGVGVASFLGHAAAADWARELDSIAIKLLLVTFVVYPLSRRWQWGSGRLVGAWAGVAAAVVIPQLIWAGLARPLLVVLAVGGLALAASAADPRTRLRFVAGAGLLAAGALAWWLGRAGGPLCAPEAGFQLHGVWHILAAGGIAALYHVHRIGAT